MAGSKALIKPKGGPMASALDQEQNLPPTIDNAGVYLWSNQESLSNDRRHPLSPYISSSMLNIRASLASSRSLNILITKDAPSMVNIFLPQIAPGDRAQYSITETNQAWE